MTSIPFSIKIQLAQIQQQLKAFAGAVPAAQVYLGHIGYAFNQLKKKGKVKMPRGVRRQKHIVTVPKPDRTELKQIYAGVITFEATSRLDVLAKALAWYDKAIDWLVDSGKMPTNATKALDIAIKSRRHGISANYDNEKENAFRLALSRYEVVCATLKPIPLKPFYEKYDAKKNALEKQAQKFSEIYQTLSDALTGALEPLDPSGHPIQIIVANTDKARKFHPELRKLVYNKPTADNLMSLMKSEGLFPVVVSEIATLSRAAALRQDTTGIYQLDATKQVAAMDRMLKRLSAYFKESGSMKLLYAKVNRPIVVQTVNVAVDATPVNGPAPKIRIPRGPRIPRQLNTSGPRVAGEFIPGSDIAKLWEFLSDGQLHTNQEIADFVQKENIQAKLSGRLSAIRKIGINNSKWELYINKKGAQMTVTS
jgi:hypothetical protein